MNKNKLLWIIVLIFIVSSSFALADSQEIQKTSIEKVQDNNLLRLMVGASLVLLGVIALFTFLPDIIFVLVPLGVSIIAGIYFSPLIIGCLLIFFGLSFTVFPFIPARVFILVPTGATFIIEHLGWL